MDTFNTDQKGVFSEANIANKDAKEAKINVKSDNGS